VAEVHRPVIALYENGVEPELPQKIHHIRRIVPAHEHGGNLAPLQFFFVLFSLNSAM
jgi:hypothetical protein